MGFDGDVAVVLSTWRNYQGFTVMPTVTLEMGEGIIELASGRGVNQFAAQPGRNQLAAVEHQAVFKLLSLFHVGGRY